MNESYISHLHTIINDLMWIWIGPFHPAGISAPCPMSGAHSSPPTRAGLGDKVQGSPLNAAGLGEVYTPCGLAMKFA